MAKYDPLQDWLRAESHRAEVTVGFAEVERLIGGALPKSAHQYSAWWANDPTHVQATAWLSAGWLVDTLDQRAGLVRFRRVP